MGVQRERRSFFIVDWGVMTADGRGSAGNHYDFIPLR